MEIGKAGNLVPVVLSGCCLALALGCGGRTLYSVPAITGFTPAQATVGSTVVITGSGFKDIDDVSFGGEPAAGYHTDSDSQITATLADNDSTGPVVVHNPAGLESSTMPFTVLPVVTTINPTQVSAAELPVTITLTGSGFLNASSVAIGTATATFTYNSPNQMTVVVPVGATTGALTLTTTPGAVYTGPTLTVTP